MSKSNAIREVAHIKNKLLLNMKRDVKQTLSLDFKVYLNGEAEPFECDLYCNGKFLGEYSMSNLVSIFTVLLIMETEKIFTFLPQSILSILEN
jgi:hypothetical protein